LLLIFKHVIAITDTTTFVIYHFFVDITVLVLLLRERQMVGR